MNEKKEKLNIELIREGRIPRANFRKVEFYRQIQDQGNLEKVEKGYFHQFVVLNDVLAVILEKEDGTIHITEFNFVKFIS